MPDFIGLTVDPVTEKVRASDLPASHQRGQPNGLAAINQYGQVVDANDVPVGTGGGGGSNGDRTFWIECPNDEDIPRPAVVPTGFVRIGWKKPTPPSTAIDDDKWEVEGAVA